MKALIAIILAAILVVVIIIAFQIKSTEVPPKDTFAKIDCELNYGGTYEFDGEEWVCNY